MQQTPPRRRRSGAAYQESQTRPTAPQQTRGRGPKRKKPAWFAMAVFIALVALLVIICPKEPISRATRTTGTADGNVDQTTGEKDSAYSGLVISELMASNRSSVPDENGEYDDWVEVWNSTDHEISLKDVGLSDRGDSIRFLFPDVTLPADGRVVVFCSDTNVSEAGKTLHAKFKLSSVGETVYLFDPSAYQIDSVTFPIMGSDESWALQADGTWASTLLYSPGYPNTEEGYQAYLTSTTVTDGAIIINEVMADAKSGLTDEDGEFSDWIELYNTTNQTISLENYALSNKENKPLKWHFPEGATIAPGGYYVVFCSGKDKVEESTGVPHTNFRISAEHDTVVLSDSRGRLVDRVTIDNLAEDCSYGRDSDGNFKVYQLATPGLPNTEAGAAQMDYNMRQMNKTGVYISEVMASDDSVQVYDDVSPCDWVELYNSSNVAVDLSNYGLSDNVGRARKWQFPEGTTIGPGEYLVVLCDGQSQLTTTTRLHASFKILRAGGETVCLSDPTGKILDKLVMPLVPTNTSYGRTLGLAGFFYYDTPTPKASNGSGFLGYAEAPELLVEPGLHYETVYTGFTIPDGCTVYYTTDGSIPTTSSTPYNGETLELNFTTVLRARAFSSTGLQPSTITTGTYFINAYHSLPIVSLTCDPDILWNEETGMFVTGANVTKVAGQLPFKNTIYRQFGKIRQEGYIEYYLLDGTQVLSQGTGFELAGDFSLDLPQKSIKFRSKSIYGEKYFNAKLFDDREYTQYKAFVLRNAGNDGVWTRLLDGFQSRLMDFYGTSIIHQAWNPVVVYINGVYWGHYNMRERIDRYFVVQHEGLSFDEASKVTILHGSGSTDYGSNKEYKAMIKKIKASDPANNPEDLQYILDNVDVDNYLEYMALEMFFGNSDIGNIRFYKTGQEGSKWKWIIYDLDYGLYNSEFNSPKSYTKSTGMGQQKIDNTIFLKLLEVPEYKDKFLRKLGDIFQTLTTENMLSVLEPLVKQLDPEMTVHFARWAEEHDQFVITEWPTSSDAAYRYWQSRIERLRNVIKKRPNKLWGFIKEEFSLSDAQMLDYFGEQPEIPD